MGPDEFISELSTRMKTVGILNGNMFYHFETQNPIPETEIEGNWIAENLHYHPAGTSIVSDICDLSNISDIAPLTLGSMEKSFFTTYFVSHRKPI